MGLTTSLLGWHVRWCAEDRSLDGHRDFTGVPLGQAEVCHVRFARHVHEDVLRLQVTVDDSGFVSFVQSRCDLRTLFDRFPNSWRVSFDPLVEARPVDEVAGNVDLPVFPADLVDGDDVRMPDLSGRPGLTQKLLGVIATHPVRTWDLNGDGPIQFRVASLPHTAERALPDAVLQLEMSQRFFMRAVVSGSLKITCQIESAPAPITRHIAGRIVIDQFNRLMAMGTSNLHSGPRLDQSGSATRQVS